MPWQDFIVGGSLNGLDFKVNKKDRTLGRRVAVSEYPGSNTPTVVDLGKKANEWRFSAWLVGPEYLGLRDDFIIMLEIAGDKVLVDTWGGESYSVRVASPVRMVETSKEGGAVRFDLHLVESGAEELAPSVIDAGAEVDNTALTALAALEPDFEGKFNGVGLLQAAAAIAFSMSGRLRQVRGKIASKLNQVENLTTAIDEFDQNIESLLLTPRAFVGVFSALVGSILGLFRGPTFSAIAAEPVGSRLAAARGALQDLFTFPDSFTPVQGETPTRKRERQNQNELGKVLKVAALVEGAKVLKTITFATGDQAVAVKEETGAYFDELLDDELTTDDLYAALVDLRSFLVRHLDELAIALPDLTEVTLPRPRVALVVAHSLYGDVSREAEIIALNGVENPAFMPANVPLKVVADDG